MEISNTEDILDGRDIIKRIEELEYTIDAEEEEELKALQALTEEGKQSQVWAYGEVLISENFFTEYCEEMCKDVGSIPHDLPWYIESHIDWDGIANDLKADYIKVNFDGIGYFIKA